MSSPRRWVIGAGLWVIAVVLAASRIANALRHLVGPRTDWRKVGDQHMLDFRDTVVLPGQSLWAGHNPYDPSTYLAAHPWAQEFDPYSPAWLTVTSPLSQLPYRVSALVFLLLLLALATFFIVSMCRWLLPQHTYWLAPVILAWSQIWYPMRATQETGSSLVVAVGTYLVVRAVFDRHLSWFVGALGMAFALTKPQFGLAVVVLLLVVAGPRLILRGVAVTAVASVPATLACLIAAHGPLPFVQSLMRDLDQASSPTSPTGLLSPVQQRMDLVGMAVRLGAAPPPQIVETAVTAAVLLAAALWLRRHPGPQSIIGLVAAVPLLVFVHMPYDYDILFLPALFFADRVRRGHRSALDIAVLVAFLEPILHIHRVSAVVGINDTAASAIDVLFLIAATLLVVVTVQRRTDRSSYSRQ